MFEMGELSKQIRMKKKAKLRPDMDYAGQDAVDPNAAWDAKQNAEVNETLGDPDHEPASASEMGENESSQDKGQLKKSSARIKKYLDAMTIKD
jgi:hypothetical protein